MARNLLEIERILLTANVVVRDRLSLSQVESLQHSLQNGQKAKFDKSLELATLVVAGVTWFESEEGQATLTTEGISWTKELFFLKVYGWQKSFAYKIVKAGQIQAEHPELITAFKAECSRVEREGETANRTIEGLLKYVKQRLANENSGSDGDGEGEEGEGGEGDATPDVTRGKALLTLAFRAVDINPESRNVSIRVEADGTLVTRNDEDEIAAMWAFLKAKLWEQGFEVA